MTQNEAFDLLKLGYNIYITGPAGSGKTHLLNKYIKFLQSKNASVGITASTGIAATHMDGITIDSWSGIGLKDHLTDKDLQEILSKRYLRDRFTTTKVLIIDEVSMLHAAKLDMLDTILKSARKTDAPFGGIQIVLSGDFFQLPPYSQNRVEADFIFKSRVWSKMDLKICYLGVSYRQKDTALLKILNAIRENDITPEILSILENKVQTGEIDRSITPTKLYTHNIDVDAINNSELEKIPEESQSYTMYSMGEEGLVAMIKRSCLAPENLVLKKGALIMFVRNNFEKGYVNGTLGKVEGFDSDRNPIVKTADGKKINVEYAKWTITENNKTRAEVSQIPLRLAWAITVHKSQGMTLSAAEIDLTKSFLLGMGYVALSRVRSLSGIRLLGFNNIALQVNPEIVEKDYEFRKESTMVVNEIRKMSFLSKFLMRRKFRYFLTS
ncbi:PIF1 family DEAD/DEAH box helicase [Patescibacteria group bacterium]|nr:PIF1 family DEAD/DEAH box helicase [Patescibacteria group bacterium]MCL5797296.1 PIF1 family DEAD/DEAH box helicase [Patescibacteria group bacterium]